MIKIALRTFWITTVVLLVICAIAYAQTATTAPLFGLDQCLWIETEDGTVYNNYCGKVIVPNGSLTDNGDGTFTLSIVAPQDPEQVVFAGENLVFAGENVFYP